MKKLLIYVMLSLALLAFVAMVTAEEKPWFDMENCVFCKHLLEDPHLLENMTYEHYDIANGLLMVSTVKPEFKESYHKAMQKMEKVGQEMAEGKLTDAYMCGSCEHYGKLMMAGVKLEHVPFSAGDIVLMTTDDPELLKMVWEHGRHNRDELKKWEQMEKEKKKEME